jgi:hypothetical protein
MSRGVIAHIRWVLLTNGVVWNLYHLSFEEGVEYVRAFSLDLSTDSADRARELLGLLERQAVKRGHLDEYWEHRAALSPESIGCAILTEETLKADPSRDPPARGNPDR